MFNMFIATVKIIGHTRSGRLDCKCRARIFSIIVRKFLSTIPLCSGTCEDDSCHSTPRIISASWSVELGNLVPLSVCILTRVLLNLVLRCSRKWWFWIGTIFFVWIGQAHLYDVWSSIFRRNNVEIGADLSVVVGEVAVWPPTRSTCIVSANTDVLRNFPWPFEIVIVKEMNIV